MRTKKETLALETALKLVPGSALVAYATQYRPVFLGKHDYEATGQWQGDIYVSLEEAMTYLHKETILAVLFPGKKVEDLPPPTRGQIRRAYRHHIKSFPLRWERLLTEATDG